MVAPAAQSANAANDFTLAVIAIIVFSPQSALRRFRRFFANRSLVGLRPVKATS
jgi:hypothetical protein